MVARMVSTRCAVLAALLAGGLLSERPALAHDPNGYDDETSSTSVYLEASSQLSSPANLSTHGGSVNYTSASDHFVRLTNNASGQQTIVYSYEMYLKHDGNDVDDNTGFDISWVAGAGAVRKIDADCSILVGASVGNHTARADASVSADAAAAWSAHDHEWERT